MMDPFGIVINSGSDTNPMFILGKFLRENCGQILHEGVPPHTGRVFDFNPNRRRDLVWHPDIVAWPPKNSPRKRSRLHLGHTKWCQSGLKVNALRSVISTTTGVMMWCWARKDLETQTGRVFWSLCRRRETDWQNRRDTMLEPPSV